MQGSIPLQPGITYGPIRSRRLGRSLGVNLLPTDRKVCSFDCVYCQYGLTTVKTLDPGEIPLPSVEQVLQSVRRALRVPYPIDSITFAGNGEPTLHPYLHEIVVGVRRLRDRFKPEARITLLSNGSTAHLSRIRQALTRIDAPVMKLDAGDRTTLARINRPVPEVSIEGIVDTLKGIPNLVIQTMLIDGQVSNARGEPFEAWLAAVTAIKPQRIQLYSIDRPVPEDGVEQVLPYILNPLAEEIARRTGLKIDTAD